MKKLLSNAKTLRQQQTNAEERLWYYLRNRRFSEFKFRRQMPMARYIVDFICLEHRLILELDGSQHADQQLDYDKARDNFLCEQGFHILRIWNHDIFENLEGVGQLINEKIDEINNTPHPRPLSRKGRGEQFSSNLQAVGRERGEQSSANLGATSKERGEQISSNCLARDKTEGEQVISNEGSESNAESLRYQLALWYAPGIGPQTYQKLTEHVVDLKLLFDKPYHYSEKYRLSSAIRDYLARPDWQQIDQALRWTEQDHQTILTPADPQYPHKLKQISDPPAILFVKGNVNCLNDPQVAIVGSRYPSAYGKDCAYQFAKLLSVQGLSITSGLALGIDTAAHEGALSTTTPTIAVLGTGLNQIYPKSNRKLIDRISENGAIVSEFPLDLAPLKHNFPRRNRIISGLSLGTLVVEAAAQSGSLITARKALSQGREVFAIPGSIHSPHSKGTHQLIREGAKLVESAYDILIEIKPALRIFLEKNQGALPLTEPEEDVKALSEDDVSHLDADYQTLLNQIDFTPTPTDLIIVRSQLTASVVSSMLLLLELKQFIVSVPGGYARVK